jgi:hypothetical protein
MTDRIIALFAFVVLGAFLAILIIKVPRVDLILLVAVTLLLAGYDVLFYRGADRNAVNRRGLSEE